MDWLNKKSPRAKSIPKPFEQPAGHGRDARTLIAQSKQPASVARARNPPVAAVNSPKAKAHAVQAKKVVNQGRETGQWNYLQGSRVAGTAGVHPPDTKWPLTKGVKQQFERLAITAGQAKPAVAQSKRAGAVLSATPFATLLRKTAAGPAAAQAKRASGGKLPVGQPNQHHDARSMNKHHPTVSALQSKILRTQPTPAKSSSLTPVADRMQGHQPEKRIMQGKRREMNSGRSQGAAAATNPGGIRWGAKPPPVQAKARVSPASFKPYVRSMSKPGSVVQPYKKTWVAATFDQWGVKTAEGHYDYEQEGILIAGGEVLHDTAVTRFKQRYPNEVGNVRLQGVLQAMCDDKGAYGSWADVYTEVRDRVAAIYEGFADTYEGKNGSIQYKDVNGGYQDGIKAIVAANMKWHRQHHASCPATQAGGFANHEEYHLNAKKDGRATSSKKNGLVAVYYSTSHAFGTYNYHLVTYKEANTSKIIPLFGGAYDAILARPY